MGETKAWTDEDQGEGKEYPQSTDSKHSGDIEDEIPPVECKHIWRAGLLANQKKVRICILCGKTEDA